MPKAEDSDAWCYKSDASKWSLDSHHPTNRCFPFIPYFFFEEEEVKFLGQHFYYVIYHAVPRGRGSRSFLRDTLKYGIISAPTCVPHNKVEFQVIYLFTAAHLGSNTNQHTDWTVGGTCIKSSRSAYALHSVQSVRLHLFMYRGGDNAHWISKNKMATMAVQWEQCGTNFRENMANLSVSCYNGNNDRSSRVLFAQHPQEQGEWLRQNPFYAWVLTAPFALLPRVLDDQHPCSLVIIP